MRYKGCIWYTFLMPLAQRLEEITDISINFSKSGVDTSRLSDYQVEMMKEAVFGLRESTGAYLSVCSKYLYELKEVLRGKSKSNPREWTQFKKSGLVPFSAKEIQDLANAWEKWLSTTDLDEDAFNLMGIRTLSRVANSDSKTKKVVEAKLLSGERVTEADVKELTGWKPKSTKPTVVGIEDILKQAETVNVKKSSAQLRKDCLTLKRKNLELEEQVKELKQQLKAKA